MTAIPNSIIQLSWFTLAVATMASLTEVSAISCQLPPDEDRIGLIARPMFSSGYSANHCGLYSLYAASYAVDHPISATRLFNGNYMFSAKGSRAMDLVKAATDQGLGATEVRGLDMLSLMGPHPVLLQLDVGDLESSYHWVACLGIEDIHAQTVRIYDPMVGSRILEAQELKQSWTGNGILVWNQSLPPPSAFLLASGARLRSTIWLLPPFLVAIAWLARELLRQRDERNFQAASSVTPTFLSSTVGASLILLFAAGWTNTLFLVNPERVSHGETMRLLACWNSFHETEIDYTRTIEPGSFVIDCRTKTDFDSGQIPGAMSLPWGTNFNATRVLASQIPPGSNVIVYCQSVECGWAALTSKRLQCFDIESQVYIGGYERYMNDQYKSTKE